MRLIMKAAGVLLVAASALMLMSCPVGPGASGPTKISIFVGFGTGTDSSQVEVHEALEKEFNETIGKEKGIVLDFIQAAYAESTQKFSTMMAGGMTPDIVGPIGMLGIGKFQEEWVDIAPLLAKDGVDVSGYSKALLDGFVMKDGDNAKQVGLPIGYFPTVLFYNKNLFDKAGLPYPPKEWGTADWTYAKLFEVAKKLTLDKNNRNANDPAFDGLKNPKQYGYAANDWGSWRGWISKYHDANGKPATLGVSDDMKTATMNSPEWKRAFADTLMLVNTGIKPKGTSEAGPALYGDNTPLGSNVCAMWEIYSWISYDFVNWDANFNWNMAAIPSMDGKIVSPTNADTFVMTKSGKNQEKAWEVYKWLFSPAIYDRLARNYKCIPALESLQANWLKDRKEGLKDPEDPEEWDYENPPRPHIDWEVMIDAGKYAANPNVEAWVPNFQRVWDAQEQAWKNIINGLATDADKLAEDLNKEVQGYIDEYWASQK